MFELSTYSYRSTCTGMRCRTGRHWASVRAVAAKAVGRTSKLTVCCRHASWVLVGVFVVARRRRDAWYWRPWWRRWRWWRGRVRVVGVVRVDRVYRHLWTRLHHTTPLSRDCACAHFWLSQSFQYSTATLSHSLSLPSASVPSLYLSHRNNTCNNNKKLSYIANRSRVSCDAIRREHL